MIHRSLSKFRSGSIAKPEQRLLLEIQDSDEDYDSLLEIIRKYPIHVIRQCSDEQGRTVLQLVLLKNKKNRDLKTVSCEAPLATAGDSHGFSPTKAPSWNWRLQSKQTKEIDPTDNLQALEKLLSFLIHSTYPELDLKEEFNNTLIDDTLLLQNQHQATRYNSLVRLPDRKTGSLPLHTACANRNALLTVVEYLVDAYPISVKCPNTIGDTPLHEAARHVAPISVIRYLVSKYPDAIKQPNEEGNLPLHLAASAETYKEDDNIVECDEKQRSNDFDDVNSSLSFIASPIPTQRRSKSDDAFDSILATSPMIPSPRGRRQKPPDSDLGSGNLVATTYSSPCRRITRNKSMQSNEPTISLVRNNSSTFSFSPIKKQSVKIPDSSTMKTFSFPVTPSKGIHRGVERFKTPPSSAFQSKPLSIAAVQQREVVKFLIECWPESVYETNNQGKTVNECAKASAVTKFLQESTVGQNGTKPSVVITQRNQLPSRPCLNRNSTISFFSSAKRQSSFRVVHSDESRHFKDKINSKDDQSKWEEKVSDENETVTTTVKPTIGKRFNDFTVIG